MTIEEITDRQANEQKLFDTAKQIRKLLDDAAEKIELPDGRDAVEEILALVGE